MGLVPEASLHTYPVGKFTWGQEFADFFAACLIIASLQRAISYRTLNLRFWDGWEESAMAESWSQVFLSANVAWKLL